MKHLTSSQPPENVPLFVDLVTSHDATNSGIPDNARYFEIAGTADSICQPEYCPSKAPDKIRGNFHFGAAVSARHATGAFQSHEVRADIDGKVWIWLPGATSRPSVFAEDHLIVDVYGFACGRSFLQSEVQYRLFVFGQEVEFGEDTGPTARLDVGYVEVFSDRKLVTRVVEPFPALWEFNTYIYDIAVSGTINLGGILRADSTHASYRSHPLTRIDLRIAAKLVSPVPSSVVAYIDNGYLPISPSL